MGRWIAEGGGSATAVSTWLLRNSLQHNTILN